MRTSLLLMLLFFGSVAVSPVCLAIKISYIDGILSLSDEQKRDLEGLVNNVDKPDKIFELSLLKISKENLEAIVAHPFLVEEPAKNPVVVTLYTFLHFYPKIKNRLIKIRLLKGKSEVFRNYTGNGLYYASNLREGNSSLLKDFLDLSETQENFFLFSESLKAEHFSFLNRKSEAILYAICSRKLRMAEYLAKNVKELGIDLIEVGDGDRRISISNQGDMQAFESTLSFSQNIFEALLAYLDGFSPRADQVAVPLLEAIFIYGKQNGRGSVHEGWPILSSKEMKDLERIAMLLVAAVHREAVEKLTAFESKDKERFELVKNLLAIKFFRKEQRADLMRVVLDLVSEEKLWYEILNEPFPDNNLRWEMVAKTRGTQNVLHQIMSPLSDPDDATKQIEILGHRFANKRRNEKFVLNAVRAICKSNSANRGSKALMDASLKQAFCEEGHVSFFEVDQNGQRKEVKMKITPPMLAIVMGYFDTFLFLYSKVSALGGFRFSTATFDDYTMDAVAKMSLKAYAAAKGEAKTKVKEMIADMKAQKRKAKSFEFKKLKSHIETLWREDKTPVSSGHKKLLARLKMLVEVTVNDLPRQFRGYSWVPYERQLSFLKELVFKAFSDLVMGKAKVDDEAKSDMIPQIEKILEPIKPDELKDDLLDYIGELFDDPSVCYIKAETKKAKKSRLQRMRESASQLHLPATAMQSTREAVAGAAGWISKSLADFSQFTSDSAGKLKATVLGSARTATPEEDVTELLGPDGDIESTGT